MRRRSAWISVLCLIAIVAIIVTVIFLSGHKRDIGECTEYKCDVKNFKFSTTIEIDKEGEEFVKIKGNLFAIFTDPLTMYDLEENKIGYAGDAYRFLAQDAHSIFVNDTSSVEMVGKIKIFGESYEIYDENEEKIATVSFNYFNTNGEMYDNEGTLIADFTSKLFFNDFDVRITPDCKLDEKTVLMIFSSYYSDQAFDSRGASSNSSSNKKSE